MPPIILALAKEPKVDDYDVSSLKHVMSAAAPLGADLQSALSTRIDAVVKQAWGMTELSPVGTVTPEEGYDPSVATSGVLVPNSKALIVDVDTGEPLDPISEGEVSFSESLVHRRWAALIIALVRSSLPTLTLIHIITTFHAPRYAHHSSGLPGLTS